MIAEPAVTNASGAQSGGVAILINNRIKGRRVELETSKEHPGRVVMATVQAGRGEVCQLISIYGYVGGDNASRHKNNHMHKNLFGELAGGGKVDWIIGGDWNMEVQEMEDAARNRARWHIPRDMKDFSTCGEKGRRID